MNKRDEEYELPTDLSKFVPYTPFTVNKRDEAVLEIDFHFLNGLGKSSYSKEEQEAFENGVYQTVNNIRKQFLQKLQEERAVAQNELLEVLEREVDRIDGFFEDVHGEEIEESPDAIKRQVISILNQHKKH